MLKVGGSPQEFGLLECLTSLHTLHLKKFRLPACLARLTSLRTLLLEDGVLVSQEDAAVCGEALPQLGALRQLRLSTLPAAVSQGLAQCSLQILDFVPTKSSIAGPADLPAGPWLAALKELAVPGAMLECSTSHLWAATQLEHVATLMTNNKRWNADSLRTTLAWAVSHAPLRLLALEGTQDLAPDAWACVLEAQRRRPDLCILPCTDAMEEVAARRRELDLF